LLLDDLVRSTSETDPSYATLMSALAIIKSVADYVNSVKGQTENMEKILEIKAKLPNADLLLKPGRSLLLEGTVSLLTSEQKPKGKTPEIKFPKSEKKPPRSKLRKKTVYLYLFTDLLLITRETHSIGNVARRKGPTFKEVARLEITNETQVLTVIDISKRENFKLLEKELLELSKTCFVLANTVEEYIFEVKEETQRDAWLRAVEQATSGKL